MILFLFVAAFLGGALNAVAGGGSFIALPALLQAGVPPVAANATSTLSLWPGSISSAWAYRREIAVAGSRALLPMLVVSLVGGLLGAELLLGTTDAVFMNVLPWLMLVAATTFTFGDRITGRLAGRARWTPSARHPWWALLLQLIIATYGGYFGGGIGVMMLAAMAVAGMTDIHEMNGLKTALAGVINGVAALEFVRRGAVAWEPGAVMIAGAITGGYVGAAVARRLDRRHVRTFAIVVAWAMTAYFFVTTS
ncbi:MAG: sulfite exporter TauE/SafE family protein [Vicinamibacterales bacterium]